MSIITPIVGGEAVVPLGALGRGHRTVRVRARKGAFAGPAVETDLYLPEWVLPDATAGDDCRRWLSYREPAGAGSGGVISTPDVTLTHPRASTRARRNPAGVFEMLLADVIAPDHDTAGTPLGVRLERLVTYERINNLLSGAVAGSPGTPPTGHSATAQAGLTRTITIGSIGGIPTIAYRYVGAPASNVQILLQMLPTATVAAAPGQVWTMGAYVAASGTGLPGLGLGLWETDAGGVLLRGTDQAIALPAAWARRSRTVTCGASTTHVRMLLGSGIIVAGTPCDFEITFGGATLTRTSYLPSEYLVGTSALTRAPDAANAALGSWFDHSRGTLLAEWAIPSPDPTAPAPGLVTISDGTPSNRIGLYHRTADATSRLVVTSGGVPQADPNWAAPPVYTYGAVRRSAVAWATDDVQGCVDGLLSLIDTGSNAIPAGLTRLDLGVLVGGNYLDGWLRRWFYVPRRMSGADMQAAHAWLAANP